MGMSAVASVLQSRMPHDVQGGNGWMEQPAHRIQAQPQQSCHEGPFDQTENLVLGSMAACKNRELCTKVK